MQLARKLPSAEILSRVSIRAVSPRAMAELGVVPTEITRLPFTVGRYSADRGTRSVDLALSDRRPYRISRNHFAIVRGRDGLAVVDTGSRSGTLVNGMSLGHGRERIRAPLRMGENVISAGGPESPYVFVITLD